MVKKLLLLLFCLVMFVGLVRADSVSPVKVTDGTNLDDFNHYGCEYTIVTSTTDWTAIDTKDGVLYDVYTIRATSTTSGTCYLVATTTTTTLFNLKVENDDENTSATDYLDNDRLMDSVGQGYPLQYRAGLKAKSSNINLDFVILHRK